MARGRYRNTDRDSGRRDIYGEDEGGITPEQSRADGRDIQNRYNDMPAYSNQDQDDQDGRGQERYPDPMNGPTRSRGGMNTKMMLASLLNQLPDEMFENGRINADRPAPFKMSQSRRDMGSAEEEARMPPAPNVRGALPADMRRLNDGSGPATDMEMQDAYGPEEEVVEGEPSPYKDRNNLYRKKNIRYGDR